MVMSPAAPLQVAEEQTSSVQGGQNVGQPKASDGPATATERTTDLRADPAERAGGAVPQVRMIGAPAPAAASLLPAAPANAAAGSGSGSGSSSTSFSLCTQGDTGYTVSPPNTGGGPEQ
jgi:hypothetical protein